MTACEECNYVFSYKDISKSDDRKPCLLYDSKKREVYYGSA
jgi:hypothetical protein